MENPYILCAAIWYRTKKEMPLQPANIENGYVIAGRRHGNIISTAMALGVITNTAKHIQGFLTSDNRFVNRSDAAKIAFNAGQTQTEVTELNSENLY